MGECLTRIVNLSLVVIGLLNSQDSHLSSLAEVIPSAATDLSIEQRVRRWLKNRAIDVRIWYEPFVKAALQLYAIPLHYLVMDSRPYGPSCRALVVGLADNGQVIPLGWRIIKGKKGHTDPALQNELLQEVAAYLRQEPSSWWQIVSSVPLNCWACCAKLAGASLSVCAAT